MDKYIKSILNSDSTIVQLTSSDLLFINEQKVKELKKSEKIRIFEINKGRMVNDKKSLLQELYLKGKFGNHFGFNWDALNDCLTEYNSSELEVIVFIYYYYKDIGKEDLEVFLKIFSAASNRYKESNIIMKLILAG